MSGHGHDHTKLYIATLSGLVLLTFITVGASYIDFGSANVVIAMAIATVKATCVALIFMHLKDDKAMNGVVFTSSLIFLGIFLGFCVLDADSRDKVPTGHLTYIEQLNIDEAKRLEKIKAAKPAPAHGAAAAEHH